MALIHRATLVPSKLGLLADWLPGKPWWHGPSEPDLLRQVGAYRFDDPEGEVGIETLLVRSGDGPLVQVPLTYRAAPVESLATALLGTMEHSVLGRRWAYDGCGDPVYVGELLRTVLTGGAGAVEEVDHGDHREPRTPSVLVRGSGDAGTPVPQVDALGASADADPTTVEVAGYRLTVARTVDGSLTGSRTLSGSWHGQDVPVTLAVVA